MKIPPFEFFEIENSKGAPSLAVKTFFNDQEIISKIPSGTSTGTKEAAVIEVDQAISMNRELNEYLVNTEFSELREFDRALIKKDGTPLREKIGGNTLLALSMMYCRLAAQEKKIELFEWLNEYYKKEFYQEVVSRRNKVEPMMVMIEGGVHATSSTNIQEILVNGTRAECMKVWEQLDKGYPMGMEGGFDITFSDQENADQSALRTIKEAMQKSGAGVTISLDIAANNIEPEDRYSVERIIELDKKYSLESIEDPFTENDWESWTRLVKEVEGRNLSTVIIGDDLIVTNKMILEEALGKNALTGVIIKPNQVGTISETLEFAALAQKNKLVTIVSHRSGETDDTFISDLAVAIRADKLKSGADSKPERTVKYERLSKIQ